MIEWSLVAFRACGSVDSIVVAAPPGRVDDLVGGDLQAPDLTVVAGGATRTRSVANALTVVETDLVAIHDAARPLLTSDLVNDLVASLAADPDAAGAIAATPVVDTIKQVKGLPEDTKDAFAVHGTVKASLVVEQTLDRSRLWAAQTPQVFRTETLRSALDAGPEAWEGTTDEAMLVEALGGKVLIHPTPGPNLKVTTPLDLRVAELLLAEQNEADS